jgi:hypothetical protein
MSVTSFAELEDLLFAHDDAALLDRAQGFVTHALGRRARVRTKTDRYPTVPLGPDTVGSYLQHHRETTWVSVRARTWADRTFAATAPRGNRTIGPARAGATP